MVYIYIFKCMKLLNLTLIDVSEHADSKNGSAILHFLNIYAFSVFFLIDISLTNFEAR